jgi:phosphate starvation-inducible PhoH-like protein
MGRKSKKYGYTEPPHEGDIKIRELIKPRSEQQKVYWESLNKFTFTIGIGPAGTGKTFLAIAAALKALDAGDVERIILTRPVVESGERLGYLPGDLGSKMDPYLRPMLDAVIDLVGARSAHKLMETQIIEICPLAYMRGRTFKNAFIVADEMSSSTPRQMKNLLTRIGHGSAIAVVGDPSQSDLPYYAENGLTHLVERIRLYGKRPDGFNLVHLTKHDIVRHPLIYQVLELYDEAIPVEL